MGILEPAGQLIAHRRRSPEHDRGIAEELFWRFVLIVTFAKGGRYIVLATATQKYA